MSLSQKRQSTGSSAELMKRKNFPVTNAPMAISARDKNLNLTLRVMSTHATLVIRQSRLKKVFGSVQNLVVRLTIAA